MIPFCGRLLMRLYLVLVACVFCLVATNAQADTINMSQDLVRLGIYSQNLAPNSPSVDAGPLFQATLTYVQSHSAITLVTLDPGAYYFLTPQDPPTAYLSFPPLSNLTLDLAGSTIYFAGAFLHGFYLVDCQNVTLTNFKIDFLQPPYTYVQLEMVDPAARTFTYKTLPGWPDPATLTAPAKADVVLWALAFRNGDIVPGTSRMQVAQPNVGGNVLSLTPENTAPWTQSATLATLQPGDIIAVTQRGGGQPVRVFNGDSISISDATIYGGSTMAVLLIMVSNSTVDHVQVIPRASNLFSTNADGIHFIDSGPNNHIRNCHVVRTLDDALVMDSLDLATVSTATQSGATQIIVAPTGNFPFPNGTAVNFIDPNSCQELPGATIVFQVPLENGTVKLTFDRPLPALAAGSGMAFASADQRGAGSSIEGNRAEDILFGRGIWIGGSVGITIQDNIIGHTSDAGVAVYQATNYSPGTSAYPVPPAHDITIQYNLVDGSLGPMASGAGTQIALGGIMVDSVNQDHAFVSSAPHTNISIQFNRVLSSGRTGIWVGQLNGGTIRHNSIIGYGLYPNLPIWGVPLDEIPQLLKDFTQALVVHNSQNVSVSDMVPVLLFLLNSCP
jgi:hypothetical protein